MTDPIKEQAEKEAMHNALKEIFEYGLYKAKYAVQYFMMGQSDEISTVLTYPIQKAIGDMKRNIDKCFSGQKNCTCPVCVVETHLREKEELKNKLSTCVVFDGSAWACSPEIETYVKSLEQKAESWERDAKWFKAECGQAGHRIEKLQQSLKAATDENEVLRRKVEETILYPHPKELQEKMKSLESQLAEANDNYKLTCGQVDGLEEALAEAGAEVDRLRERSDLFQTTMIKYHKQLTQERQLADDLAETLNYVAKYIKPNQDGYYYTTTALSKHKKRRGKG